MHLITFLMNHYTYHSRFIPEVVAEVSQIFLRDTHVLPKLVNYEEHCRLDTPLVAFYDIHEGKRAVLFFYFCPGHPTRQLFESLYLLKTLHLSTLGNSKYLNILKDRQREATVLHYVSKNGKFSTSEKTGSIIISF
jgi:hypothetical protein